MKSQTFVRVAINLLLTAMVTLLTALLVGVIVVIPVSLWVAFMVASHLHKVVVGKGGYSRMRTQTISKITFIQVIFHT